MNKSFNASYKFSCGEINFQFDIDQTLSLNKSLSNYVVSDDKDFHNHPFYEIFFVFDNEMKIVFENDTKTYKNCVICLPPNTKHYSIRSTDYRILFSYNKKNTKKGIFENFISNVFATENLCQIPFISSGLNGYLKELCKVFYNQKTDLDQEIIVSLIKCILYDIYSLYASNESTTQKDYYLNESRYISISSLIKKCTSKENDITIATIADALCLSKKQTARIISKYYGKTLAEVITEEKLNYATYLLKNTNLSIYDIAFESNFNSYSYFCRCFSKKFGCLPLRYRKDNNLIYNPKHVDF